MTTPTTPGGAIVNAAQRLQQQREATLARSKALAAQRQGESKDSGAQTEEKP